MFLASKSKRNSEGEKKKKEKSYLVYYGTDLSGSPGHFQKSVVCSAEIAAWFFSPISIFPWFDLKLGKMSPHLLGFCFRKCDVLWRADQSPRSFVHLPVVKDAFLINL